MFLVETINYPKFKNSSRTLFAHVFGSCVRGFRVVLQPLEIVDLPVGMTCQIPGPDCLHQQHAPTEYSLSATWRQVCPLAAVLAVPTVSAHRLEHRFSVTAL
jgi:hypothetical protein